MAKKVEDANIEQPVEAIVENQGPAIVEPVESPAENPETIPAEAVETANETPKTAIAEPVESMVDSPETDFVKMEVVVLKRFRDRYDHRTWYEVGMTLDFDAERAGDVIARGYAKAAD